MNYIDKKLEEFEKFIEGLNDKHDWCIGHNEGQFCHLDNDEKNTENVVPELKSFLKQALEEQREFLRKELVEEIENYPDYNADYKEGKEQALQIINENINGKKK